MQRKQKDMRDDSLAEGRGLGGAESEPELLRGDTDGVEDLSVDGVFVHVNQVLLRDPLHSSFRAETRDIESDVAVSVGGDLPERSECDSCKRNNWKMYLFKVHIISQLHVLGVDKEDFEAASWVEDGNGDFAIEATETTEGRVDRVVVAAIATTFEQALTPSMRVRIVKDNFAVGLGITVSCNTG